MGKEEIIKLQIEWRSAHQREELPNELIDELIKCNNENLKLTKKGKCLIRILYFIRYEIMKREFEG